MSAIDVRKLPCRLTLVCVVTLLLGGCWKTTGTGVTEVCDFWEPIGWSQKDTPQTILEVKVNNAKQKAWCR
jgi:hypothetical protein